MAHISKQTPEFAIRSVVKGDIEALEARVSELEATVEMLKKSMAAKPEPKPEP